MFDRQTFHQLEALFARTGTGPQRLHRLSIGMLILLQAIFESLTTVQKLWDNGFGAQVDSAEPNSIVNGYTRRWWLTLAAVYSVYTVAMKAPLGYLASLEDGEGNRPFAVFDPTPLGELAALSIEQVAWREPETSIQTIDEESVEGSQDEG